MDFLQTPTVNSNDPLPETTVQIAARNTPRTHVPPPVCQISHKSIYMTDSGQHGVFLLCLKNSRQPCNVLIFAHQGVPQCTYAM